MNNDQIRDEVIKKIVALAQRNDGKPPGVERFEAETGIKRHKLLGPIWRTWADALGEAGFAPNVLNKAFSDEKILSSVLEISKAIGRFPTTGDLAFETTRRPDAPNRKTIGKRWNMVELAEALVTYAEGLGETDVVANARQYLSTRTPRAASVEIAEDKFPSGYVYMQRHGNDYKIGFTSSLSKRGRQIQIELPQEIELVHSILTDDPSGV
ncbi:GIY-YIG nuclease family protein [Pararhizobium sp.]|uniref:GIY-YIG nuclease family protein n=1 Tax=Pararhizobium sp. TaxID=1977563 RepID=UPI0027262EF0|nr:GIY-YIG nuclease family protein [Pararhizobium sp.]MDO9415386.1 GIY-YIG nuclease family protein [Pararhizobium sp.]